MHPTDWIVQQVSRWQPFWRNLIHPFLVPLIILRAREIGTIIGNCCISLPNIHWSLVIKHGQNAVYYVYPNGNVWVVDYLNHTFRVIQEIPAELQFIGATF